MLKRIMAVAAVSGLALTAAQAQTSTTPSTTTTTPQATSSAPAPSAAGKADFVGKQTPDQHLASKFKGTDVIGTDDKKIGDVSDVLFDKDNKVVAFIVGVGGFLGIGQKDVAIAPTSFQTVSGTGDSSDLKLRLAMSKDELKAAPTFERYTPPRPVSSENGTRPMGAPSPTPKSSTQ